MSRGYSVQRTNYIQPNISGVTEILVALADKNYDIIFVTSNDYSDSIVNFTAKGRPYNETNLMSIQPYGLGPYHSGTGGRGYLGRYLGGVMCGASGAKKVGYMAPKPGGGTYNGINAFSIGVRKYNPTAEIFVLFTNDWYDPVLEYKAAKRMVEDWGIECATGPLDAVRAWHELEIPSTAYFSDAAVLIGPNVYFSVIYNWNTPFQWALDHVINGTYAGASYLFGGFGDQIDISTYSTQMPIALKATVEAERRALLNATSEIVLCQPAMAGYIVNPANNRTCYTDSQISYMKAMLPFVQNPFNLTHPEVIETVFLHYDSPLALTTQILAAILLALCLSLIIYVLLLQETAILRSASPIFLVVILIGWIILLISIFFWPGEPTDGLCLSRLWLSGIGFCVVFSAAWAKNYRIVEILTNDSLKIFAITNFNLFIRVGLCLGVEFIILILWSSLDQYRQVTLTTGYSLAFDQIGTACQSQSIWGISLFLAYKFVLVLINGVLAWRARVIRHDHFNESAPLALSVYTSLLIGIIAIAILTSIPYTVALEAGIISFYILLISAVFLVAMFGPKLYTLHILRYPNAWSQNKGGRHTTTTTYGNSTASNRKPTGSTTNSSELSTPKSSVKAPKSNTSATKTDDSSSSSSSDSE